MEKMEWSQLLSAVRFGQEDYHSDKNPDRSEFQRDYDRLIFSPSFRRLQNKTQVFPLPGNIFVHNRLTHSLEVSSVGRSLSSTVSHKLMELHNWPCNHLVSDIESIVSSACLAHDMGNPPFGHSGEKAIASYFSEGPGLALKEQFHISNAQWDDIIYFEGNANAFRLLTHQFKNHRKGGFVLTYSTLASIVKYPYQSTYCEHQKKTKFGFFQSEKEAYQLIAKRLGILALSENKYARHPLVYLVEAADDICYEMMDLEDAFKLRLLTYDEITQLYLNFLTPEQQEHKRHVMTYFADDNETMAYLRSSIVGVLVEACSDVFVQHEEEILSGTFTGSLIENMPSLLKKAYAECQRVSGSKIYCSQMVVDIEIAGYNIIYELIDRLVQAIFNPQKSYSKVLLPRVPEQYGFADAATAYDKLLAVLDYVSSMTDVYALDLYQKITGMSLPNL